ncbi:MAG: hypothetical protein ABSF61_04355 [Anaerolineales bacterium]|jgi:hypothetical protein
MATTILIHLLNEDSIVGEVEALPPPEANFVAVTNPRRRDGKDIEYLQENVTRIVIAGHRISVIEVLPSAGEEQLVTFVRE